MSDNRAGDLGRRVAHRRKQLGLSRKELAERCGMASEYIAYLEENPAVATADTLSRLASGLQTTPEELLGAARDDGMTGGRLEELDRDECLRLISPGGIGRLVFTGRHGLTVVPVNYRMQGESVVFRTVAGGSTDEDLRTGWAGLEYTVAFQVDHIDEATKEGWSVLLQGPAHHVTTEEERAALTGLGVTPWAAGERELYMRITPTRVTGRRLHAAT